MARSLRLVLATLALTAAALSSGAAGQTIASVASGPPSLSILAALLNACPTVLQAAQNASTAVTVFAPNNQVRRSHAFLAAHLFMFAASGHIPEE